MKIFVDALKRTAALLVAEVSGFMGAGSILGQDWWISALQTAMAALLTVSGAIALAYYKDGKLTKAELDHIFDEAAEKDKNK